MSAAAETLIRDLAARGIHLASLGEGLRIAAPRGTLTPELRQTLSDAKPAILAALAAADVRGRLLAFAAAEGVDTELIRKMLPSDVADLLAMTDGSDAALRDYLHVLRDAAMRERGQVPEDETVAVLCRHCGPFWMHPGVARVLPVVGGMPTAAGCAWCHLRARGLPIPRPLVTCGACRHFVPDRINPAGGLGECGAGVARGKVPYPFATHTCAKWRPRPDADTRRPQETR
jgi:hypothetical protein